MMTFRLFSFSFLATILCIVFAVFLTTVEAAGPTPTINYQGKLTDSAGVAVPNGTYNMRFYLYNAIGGATTTAIWTETLTTTNKVQVTNGLFSVMLGSTTPLTSVDFNQTLYLGLEIGGSGAVSWDGEMSPRKPLGTVPAAFEAFKLGGVASSSFLRSDQADAMSATSASTLLSITQLGAGDILNLSNTGGEVLTVLNDGKVGIGTSSPLAKLTIQGTAGSDAVLNIASSTGASLLTVLANGNVGVGTSSPDAKLTINSVPGSTGLNITNNSGASLAKFYNYSNEYLIQSLYRSSGSTVGVQFNPDGNSGPLILTDATQFNLSDGVSGVFGAGLSIRTPYTVGQENGILFHNSPDMSSPGGAVTFYTTDASNYGKGGLNFKTSSTTNGLKTQMTIDQHGRIGIGTTSPFAKLSVTGDIALTGGIYDNSATRGTNGQVLQTTGTGVSWVSTTTLGFLNNLFGSTIDPTELTATDFGSFTCNGTTCSVDTDAITSAMILDDSINYTDILYTATIGTDPTFGASETYFGSTGLIFEGSSADAFEGLLTTTNITGSDKTWTLPNTTGTIALLTSAMTGTFDGNNFGGGAIGTGDILYGSAAGVISELAGVATGNVLISGGVSTAPAWGKVGLTTHVSGTLAATNGGTGLNTINANELLIGGAGNTWSQIATTSLGLSSAFTNSAELAALLSDETGTGLAVFATNPLLTGFRSYASSTIGDGTAGGGLTVSGNSTTTGNAYFAGNVGVGSSSPSAKLTIQGTAGVADVFKVASSTGSNMLAILADGNLELPGQLISAGIEWTSHSATEANSWGSVTYGNGLFVAVSYSGTNRVMTSPDGITWTARSAAEANGWISITYGNGLFVAVSYDGTNRVMTSPDGITWTARSATEANQWVSVTYNKGLFVAVANTGTNRVMTSPDGITWTARSAAEANSWQSVTYGNGLFVAVAYTGTNRVMTSPDGITWTPHSASEANGWISVTYGNGLFVAVSEDGTNRVMTSPDGITWTARSASEANSWRSVTYGNGLFVAVSSSGTNEVMTSPDGITWTARDAGSDKWWNSVTYGNGLFVVVAYGGGGTNLIITSGKSSVNMLVHNNIYQGGMSVLGGPFNIGTTTTTANPAYNNVFNVASTTGSSLFVITSAGNVGIGSSSPNYKLTIAGDANIYDTTSATAGYRINSTPVLTGSTTANTYFFAGASSTSFTNGATYNYAIGDGAMSNLVDGDNNFAVGLEALQGVGMSGSGNNALGFESLHSNTSGSFNNAIGYNTLHQNTTGSSSNAFGIQALYSNTTGSNNNSFGNSALYSNTTGSNNTAFGYASLFSNTSGGNNNSFGNGALIANITGSFNNALGYNTLYNNNGTGTIAIGYKTADNALTVDRGIFIGYDIDAFSTTADDVLNIGNLIFGTGVDGTGTTLSTGNIGIGTSSPNARLSIQNTAFSGAGVVGLDQYLDTQNSVASAVQYGNRFYLNTANTATTTTVGSMFRIKDSTVYGNTIRGLEVQTDRGTNTQGENTALSGFARTFGVRGTTAGDAGGTFEPAGIYGQTDGTSQGNAIRGYSSYITSAALMKLFHASSTFTGTGLLMNFGNSGGSFSSTTSKYLDFQNGGTSVFTVSAHGTTTIGDGTTSKWAGLQIGNGGLCVDDDGSCLATVKGRIASVSTYAGNSDLAENYFSSADLEPGEIVTLAGGLSINRATKDSTTPILGVVSTKPGLLLGSDDTSLNAGETAFPVALSGRVPVKLSTEAGPIKKGDQLMMSSLPGIAMKATSTGVTIGIALEDFDDTRKYSNTYINQFGDDLVEPVFTPINRDNDPRINDGCYFGAGNASGEEACVPLIATTTDARIKEAEALALAAAQKAALDKLARTPSQKLKLANNQTVQVGQVVMFVQAGYRYFDAQGQNMLASLLMTASTTATDYTNQAITTNTKETVWQRMVKLANNFIDGVLSVFTLKAERVEVREELCVDGVCVNADDLRQILNKSQESSGGGGGGTTVVEDSTPPPPPPEEVIPEEESYTTGEETEEETVEVEVVNEESVVEEVGEIVEDETPIEIEEENTEPEVIEEVVEEPEMEVEELLPEVPEVVVETSNQ